MIDLKPCPFCGGKARAMSDDGRWYVACVGTDDCYAALGEAYDKYGDADHNYYQRDIAEAAWNARASDWQPIETAPRDGSRLWLYEPSYGYEGWWHEDWPRGEAYWMDDRDSEPEPTHWRPLPDPPPHSPARTE